MPGFKDYAIIILFIFCSGQNYIFIGMQMEDNNRYKKTKKEVKACECRVYKKDKKSKR